MKIRKNSLAVTREAASMSCDGMRQRVEPGPLTREAYVHDGGGG